MSYQSDLLNCLVNRLNNDLPSLLNRMELLQSSHQSLKKVIEDNTKQQLMTTIYNLCEFNERHKELNIMTDSEEKETLQLIKKEAMKDINHKIK